MMDNSQYQSDSILNITLALLKAQQALEVASKDSQAHKYKYADLNSVWDVAKGPLRDNNLCFTSSVIYENSEPYLRAMLIHTSGEYFISYTPLYRGKNDMQALGSAITYARRYSLSSMLGVMADDDDGKKACETVEPAKASTPVFAPPPAVKMINLEQIKELTAEIQTCSNAADVYAWIFAKTKVDSLSKLTEAHFFNILASLKKVQA